MHFSRKKDCALCFRPGPYWSLLTLSAPANDAHVVEAFLAVLANELSVTTSAVRAPLVREMYAGKTRDVAVIPTDAACPRSEENVISDTGAHADDRKELDVEKLCGRVGR